MGLLLVGLWPARAAGLKIKFKDFLQDPFSPTERYISPRGGTHSKILLVQRLKPTAGVDW